MNWARMNLLKLSLMTSIKKILRWTNNKTAIHKTRIKTSSNQNLSQEEIVKITKCEALVIASSLSLMQFQSIHNSFLSASTARRPIPSCLIWKITYIHIEAWLHTNAVSAVRSSVIGPIRIAMRNKFVQNTLDRDCCVRVKNEGIDSTCLHCIRLSFLWN